MSRYHRQSEESLLAALLALILISLIVTPMFAAAFDVVWSRAFLGTFGLLICLRVGR